MAKQKLTRSISGYYSFTARSWSLVFDPKRLNFSIRSEQHKTTYKSPGSYSAPYSLPSLWKICKRISPLSPFWSGNVTTSTRAPLTCAWIQSPLKFSKNLRWLWTPCTEFLLNFAKSCVLSCLSNVDNTMVGQFFDSMIVASSDKEWL